MPELDPALHYGVPGFELARYRGLEAATQALIEAVREAVDVDSVPGLAQYVANAQAHLPRQPRRRAT